MDWIKINTDGSVIHETHQVACGGLLCDSSGAFHVGFACKLGNCTVMQAELYGIWYGLRIARCRGFPKVHV